MVVVLFLGLLSLCLFVVVGCFGVLCFVVVAGCCGVLLCCIDFCRVLVCVFVVGGCSVFVGCCRVLLCLLVVVGCGFVVVVFCIGLRNGSTCHTMCCCILLHGICVFVGSI